MLVQVVTVVRGASVIGGGGVARFLAAAECCPQNFDADSAQNWGLQLCRKRA